VIKAATSALKSLADTAKIPACLDITSVASTKPNYATQRQQCGGHFSLLADSKQPSGVTRGKIPYDCNRCKTVNKAGADIRNFCLFFQPPTTLTGRIRAGVAADFWAFDSMRPPPQP